MATEIYFRKKDGALHPISQEDQDKLSLIKGVVKAVISKPRNSGFHRKYFALLNLVYENQDKFDNFELFRLAVQDKCGLYKVFFVDGHEVRIPKSISFGSMDQTEFEAFYEKILQVVLETFFLEGLTMEEIDAQVASRLEFA